MAKPKYVAYLQVGISAKEMTQLFSTITDQVRYALAETIDSDGELSDKEINHIFISKTITEAVVENQEYILKNLAQKVSKELDCDDLVYRNGLSVEKSVFNQLVKQFTPVHKEATKDIKLKRAVEEVISLQKIATNLGYKLVKI